MPLPKPSEDESRKQFVDRCMADEVMNSEFPEREQRYAVCNSQYERAYMKKMKSSTK